MSAMMAVRAHRNVGLGLVLLFASTFAGCLGSPQPDTSAMPVFVPLDEPDPEAVHTEAIAEPGTLRIHGDRMLDRLAERMRWSGTGSVADPYHIPDLELDGKSLVFQDLTRAVHLSGASIVGAQGQPGLLLWNVTGLTVTDSTITASGGPAVSLLETAWVRIESNILHSDTETVAGIAAAMTDVFDNDLYAGGAAVRFQDGHGDHWIEGNRIHQGTIGLHVSNARFPSAFVDNRVSAETGVVVEEIAGTVLQANELRGPVGVRLSAADDTLLLENTIAGTQSGILVHHSDRVVADQNTLTVGGVTVEQSAFVLIANLTYAGDGPAVHVEGGRTVIVEEPNITLPIGAGTGIVMRDTVQPLVLGGSIDLGENSIILRGTDEATVLRTTLRGPSNAAVLLTDTEGTLVAQSTIEVAEHGVAATGGTATQIVENTFLYNDKAITVQDTDAPDVAFNQIERAMTGIRLLGTRGAIAEGNVLAAPQQGILLQGGHGATLQANVITRSSGDAVTVTEHQGGEGLLVLENHIANGDRAAFAFDRVDRLTMRTNTLLSNGGTAAKGGALSLKDVVASEIFDNYFDNSINVLATGRLDVAWQRAPEPGVNVRGGGIVAGNWWSDYTGVDIDEDGIGDVQHGVIPYKEELALLGVPNYGLADEHPIVADSGVPGLPLSAPGRDPTLERIHALLGQSPVLDAILQRYA